MVFFYSVKMPAQINEFPYASIRIPNTILAVGKPNEQDRYRNATKSDLLKTFSSGLQKDKARKRHP